MKKNRWKVLLFGNIILLPAEWYIGGILGQLISGYGKYFLNESSNNITFTLSGIKEIYISNLTNALIGAAIAFVAANIFLIYVFLTSKKSGLEDDDRNFTISESGAYGTSGWMSKEEQKAVLNTPESAKTTNEIILGKEIDTDKPITIPQKSRMNHHIAVFGASGTKKTRAYVRNHMLQIVKREESMILTDPSGELFEGMSPYLRDNGYTVRVLNLVNLEYSDSWNCLKEISDDLSAQIFADVIIQNTGGKASSDFWAQCEMNLLKALCLYVVINPNIPTNMSEVYNLLTTRTPIELDRLFDELPFNDETQAAKAAYNIFKQANDNVKGGVVIGLGSRLQVFQGGLVREITSHEEIDLNAPGYKKCAFFCITSDQHSAFDFLAVLFYSMLFIKLVSYAQLHGENRKLPVEVNFILDEFPNIGAIPDFCKKISTVRKYGINISVIFQNIAQLQNRYPYGQWEEIIGNCDTSLFLGCNDNTTAKYISDNSGVVTIAVQSKTHSKTIGNPLNSMDFKESNSIGKRNLLTPDEVKRLDNDIELILIRGQKPLKAIKFDYSEHPESNKLKEGRVVDYTPEWRKAKQSTVTEPAPKAKIEVVDGEVREKKINLKDYVKTKESKPKGFT